MKKAIKMKYCVELLFYILIKEHVAAIKCFCFPVDPFIHYICLYLYFITMQGSQNCSAIVYEGSQCTNYFGTCSKPLINLETNTTKEDNIRLLFFVLDTQQLSDTCEQEKSILNEFICQYAYQPCDDFNDIIIPSRNVCEHLRDSACKPEWDLIANGEFGTTLPNCNELPEAPLQPNCTDDDGKINTLYVECVCYIQPA